MTHALDERADTKKPYGDVTYADPGHQADGTKRYPLDSEEHCRAAWSYINMPKNAAKYTAEQLKSIKAKIKAAGKKYGIEFGGDRSDEDQSELRRALLEPCERAYTFEARGSSDGRTLEGHVAVFGAVARISDRKGDFDEEIHRGVFDRYIGERGFPVMQFDHGKDTRVGSVPIGVYDTFEPDNRGYFVRGRLLDNPVVEPVRQAIEAKALRGMSFRFMVTDERGHRWTRRSGQVDKRDVLDADVPEAGPVVFPAYHETSVSVRSILDRLGPDETRELIRELAAQAGLAVDLNDFTGRPDARSAGGGDDDAQAQERDASPESTTQQRLDQGALQLRGILK